MSIIFYSQCLQVMKNKKNYICKKDSKYFKLPRSGFNSKTWSEYDIPATKYVIYTFLINILMLKKTK